MTDNLHQYTRKELIGWVESTTKYKFEDLKNGVFFCKVLTLKFPEELARLKYNAQPISNYECTRNLELMKKVLNRKGLQMNLNTNDILTSKSNFEMAKWFKNLMDGNVSIVNPGDNLSLPPRPSLTSRRDKTERTKEIDTPRKLTSCKSDHQFKVESAQKPKKVSSNKQQRLSMAKSSSNRFFKKESMQSDIPAPSVPPLNRPKTNADPRKSRQQPSSKLYSTQLSMKKQFVWDEADSDIREQLYERALQESIQTFQKMLEKIKTATNSNKQTSLHGYKDSIKRAIFTK